MITVYGFEQVAKPAVGLTRDMRTLWALEEAGLPYRVEGLDFGAGELKTDAYLLKSPFQQIPVIEDGGLTIAESGATVLYVAEKSDGRLMPASQEGRWATLQWCFAALNTIELPVMQLAMSDASADEDASAKQRRPKLVEACHHQLGYLERWLEGRTWVVGDSFTAADILMAHVLRGARRLGAIEGFPRCIAYLERAEERPAWKRTVDKYEERLHVPRGSAAA